MDPDCQGRGLVCHEASGACVTCDENDAQATPPNQAGDDCQTIGMQVCDADSHTCRACEAGSECASDVCDAGTCIVSSMVAYVAMTGSGGDCSQSTPCAMMAAAIATGRPYILVAPGTYDGAVDFNADDAIVYAEGATFRRSSNGRVLFVHGASGSNVTIYGGTFDGSGGDDADVVEVASGSSLVVDGTTIRRGEAKGLVVAGALTARRCQVSNNETVGIEIVSTTGTTEVSSCKILSNARNGMAINANTAIVVNNIIAKNGLDGAYAALRIDGISNLAGSTISHNTITGNAADANSPAAAVSCIGSIRLSNSILYDNRGLAQVVGCLVDHSSLSGTLPVGDGNISVAPVFRDTSANDYHLAATGNDGLKNVGDPAVATGAAATDMDGDPRPLPPATNPDLGADEIE